LIWRLVKWLGIAWFVGGLGLAVGSTSPRSRLLGAFGVATPGLFVVWMAGYGLMKATGGAIGEPYIQYSLLASVVALAGGAIAALMRHRAVGLALAVGGLASSMGLMTGRGDAAALVVLGGVVPGLLAAAAGLVGLWLPRADTDARLARRAVHHWFVWVARAEGVSLLVLFGLFMPLKYGAGIEIDGGDGWVGWVHGVLVFQYLVALGAGVVFNRWGTVAAVVGFFASVLPFGTFAFEWWLTRRDVRPSVARS
jgi:integral membrane protein